MENKGIEFIKEERPNNLRKIFIMILALFLIVIIVTYFITDFNIRNIIVGLIESNKVYSNIVNINENSKLIFKNNTYEKLLEIYNNNPEREFKVCLKGDIIDNNYIINKIYIPTTYSQSPNQVIAEPCSDDSLVDMHSHPLKHCLPSEQDFISFNSFKEKNNNAIMAVMCQRNRFNFYI